MNWELSLIITCFFIIIGFIFKSSKKVMFLQLIWMWILIAFNTGGIDYNVHVISYFNVSDQIKIFSNAWLYKLFCYPFFINKLEFWQFNMFISTILIILIYYIIKNNTNNVAIWCSLFYIYPLADCIIQKRNFLANVIIVIAFLELIKNNKKSTTKFIILTLIAAQIHSSYYFYLIVLPLFKLNNKIFKKILLMILVIAFSIIPCIPNLAELILKNTSIISKVNAYFVDMKIPLYESICWWGLQITITILFNKFQHIDNQYFDKDDKESKRLIKINNCLLIFIPLYYYEPTFFRFFRNLLIINYIYAVKKIEKNYILTQNIFYFFCIILFSIIMVFISQFVWFGLGFDILIKPLFLKNKVLGV